MTMLVSLGLPPDGAASSDDPSSAVGHPPSACPRVRPLDLTAARRLRSLQESSRAARDALLLLCAQPHVWITVTSSAGLLRHDRSRGLSHFWIEDGVLVGRLRFDTGGSTARQQARALAHELAHAVEFALLPPQRDTRALAAALLVRIGRHLPWWRDIRLETPFAIALEEAIMREIEGGTDTGALRRLARDHALSVAEPSTPAVAGSGAKQP